MTINVLQPIGFEMRMLTPEEREALREYVAAGLPARRDASEETSDQSRKATFCRAFDWFFVFIRTRLQP